VYPEPPGRGFEPLTWIAQHFDCVELNTTFYRAPSARMAEGWVRKTEGFPDFTFTAKLWQKFSHDREGFTDRDVAAYREGIGPLARAGKLGALLVQFPWFFEDGAEARAKIDGIAGHFRDLAPVFVEVRHVSFGSSDFLDFLRGKEIGFCNIDQPRSRSSLTGTTHVTGPAGYVRLHGRNREAWFRKGAGRDEKYDYLYSEEELAPWVRTAREMAAEVPAVFFILNNHFQGKAPANALMVQRALGRTPSVPPPLRRTYPDLFIH
jgi:uncharacterized protein YecE (DUF72 family)